MTSTLSLALAVLVTVALAPLAAPMLDQAPRLLRLDGASATPGAGTPLVLLFWRADCGPCLLELSDLKALRVAARPGRVLPVGLQPASTLRPALARLHLRDEDSLQTPDDAAALLTALGGNPPRLPLAVAYRADGSVCGRRTGLLGRNQVRAWARSCGGGDAHR